MTSAGWTPQEIASALADQESHAFERGLAAGRAEVAPVLRALGLAAFSYTDEGMRLIMDRRGAAISWLGHRGVFGQVAEACLDAAEPGQDSDSDSGGEPMEPDVSDRRRMWGTP